MVLCGGNLSITDVYVHIGEQYELDGNNVEPGSHQVKVEDTVIVDSDAVVDPQAVMVPAIDASIANVTVEAFHRPQEFT
jgi:hypothetical protein